MPNPPIRCCKVCLITKDIKTFSSNNNKTLSYSHTCIECMKDIIKIRNKRNYAKIKTKQKEQKEQEILI
jgi:hypothetical protein